MTNNTIPHDHHRLRPHHHQEMDQLQALAVKPQAKKQARRRTHTSRPYQERLLNMAEARREIVTALKIHRASSTRQHQQSTFQHHHEPPPPPRQPPLQQLRQQQEQEEQQQVQVAFQDRRQAAVAEEASLAQTTMSYAAASFASNPLCSSPAAHWIAAGGSYCAPRPILRLPCDLTPPEPELPPTAAAMVGLVELEHYQGDLERLVRSLPAQPLGLNLSFQGFGVAVDDGAKVPKDDCEDLFGSLPLTQPSPAASHSTSPPAVETTATAHACGGGHGSPSPAHSAAVDAENEKHSVVDAPPAAAAALVPVLLDGWTEMTMAQQQASIGGETQGVEWAADVAAWWSKIFESGQRAPPNAEDVAAAGLPAEWRWLCGDDDVGAAEQGAAVTGDALATTMHVDGGDYYSCCYEGPRSRSDDGEDVNLPCMDGIGDDVQGWDGEWFSCS